MSTFLLEVPVKKTEEINWTKPLNNYLLSIYGNTSEYQSDLTAFNKLRSDLRGVNPDNNGIKMYCKYYSQVELLDLRIPFATVNKHKKIEFVWYDVFHHGVEHSQHALPFEKANVLFNLGAVLSKVAVSKYKDSKDGVSSGESIQLFSQAAGVFQFLNENFLHAPSADLSQATVKFLVKLMLAQSQEVFVLKVISADVEQAKNSLISKLCRSAAFHYESCFSMISHLTGASDFADEDQDDDDDDELETIDPINAPAESTKKVNAPLDISWLATIHLKLLYYKSLAFYYNGLHLESARKYGEALAYLTKSAEILNEVSPATLKGVAKSPSNDVYELLDIVKYQRDAVGIKLADLNKDNDLIYHSIIPSLVTLPDIKPMDSSKIIPINENKVFQEVNDHNYGNFLNNVVPINIHELLSYYSEEKSQFLRNEIDLVDVSNEELSSVLEFLHLPKDLAELKAVVSNVEGKEGFDAALATKADEIAAKYTTDAANKEKVSKMRKEIYDTVTETDSLLSGNFLAHFKEDILKIKKSLYDASNSDTKLFELVGDSKLYSILGKGSQSAEFQGLFTSGGVSTGTEISLLDFDDNSKGTTDVESQIKQVEDLMYDLNMLKSTKNKLIESLKAEIHGDEISDILILNSRIKSTNEIKSVIFPAELKKFQPYNEELDKLLQKQKELVEQLKEKWGYLNSNQEVKKLQKDKSTETNLVAIQSGKIAQLYDNWSKYTIGLARGAEFYAKLLQYAVGLRSRVQKELKAQSESKAQADFTGGFANMNITGGSASGPAIPPRQYQQSPQNPQYQASQNAGYYSGGAPSLGYQQQQQQQQPQQFSSPMLYGGTNGAPQLPPKRPSQGQLSHAPQGSQYGQQGSQYGQQGSQYGQPGGQYAPQGAQPPIQQSPYGQQAPPQGNQPGNNSNLIYDQPSTYDPNMYNFFGK